MSRQRFSGFSLLWNSLGKHQGWREQWRRAEPQAEYDAIIVGGGGHGLGTAYYLAAEHGLTRIAVLEKGWIGGGNTGRNTTIIRSNYLFDESARLYDHSVKMWEHLSQVLNYNVMFSPRGVMMLAHTVHDVQVAQRHIHANRCNGVDNEWLTPEDAKAFCPPLNIDPGLRYPVLGAALQRRGGTARHDAVAWGYARAADALGVDIIENCEVTGIRRDAGGAVEALETTRGVIRSRKVGVVAAGNTSVVLGMAGVRVPLESFPLQALVSEPIKPVFPCVVMSNGIHAYISQSDKGELVIGAGTDAYTSYTQRGALHVNMHPSTRPSRSTASAKGTSSTKPLPRPSRTEPAMLLIRCPHCGERPEPEFAYGGEAHIARPADPAAVSDDDWAAYLYLRTNAKGVHAERWRHTRGCGRFFNALRDTTTDRFIATYKSGEKRPEGLR